MSSRIIIFILKPSITYTIKQVDELKPNIHLKGEKKNYN